MRYSMPCPLGITAGGVTGTIQEAGAFMAQLVMDHNGLALTALSSRSPLAKMLLDYALRQ